jgi:hypothetical protein
MPTNEHLVLCGGATAQGKGDATRLELNLHGTSANVRLEIEDISRRLIASISRPTVRSLAAERPTHNLAHGGGENSVS